MGGLKLDGYQIHTLGIESADFPKSPDCRVPKYLGFYWTSAESDNGTQP